MRICDPELLRLIPARAGKTALLWRWGWSGRAHPRACGENPHGPAFHVGPAGSSPRVRGKPVISASRFAPAGLIPARAGKTVTDPTFTF